jgi:hypothetical protein
VILAQKKFSFKRNLVRHIKEKHGVELQYFVCPKLGCNGNTIRRDYLRKRLIKLHGVDTDEARELSYSTPMSKYVTRADLSSEVQMPSHYSDSENLVSICKRHNDAEHTIPYSSVEDISSEELPHSFQPSSISRNTTCTAVYSDLEDVSSADIYEEKNSSDEVNDYIDDITDVELEPRPDISIDELQIHQGQKRNHKLQKCGCRF